jgi:hypothetical protein
MMSDTTESAASKSVQTETRPFLVGALWTGLWTDLQQLAGHWRLLLLSGFFFALLGAGYAWFKKPVYQARVSFVIEENKQNAGGLFSALAGQIGMDLSALSGTSGVLAGDNVLELLKSPTLLKKVLLSPYPGDTSHSLAWHYAIANDKLEQYQRKSGKQDLFAVEGMPAQKNRVEDSLLIVMVNRIIEKEISVYKPDRKLSVFRLDLTTRSEALSALMSMRLIRKASDFYIETKTRRLRINVDRLQGKADSIAGLLNNKTTVAASKDLLNANPAYISTTVDAEISTREKSMLSILYSDLNKSLDLTRTALIQETPTIELIDTPDLPLKKIYTSYPLAMMIGFLCGVLLFGILGKTVMHRIH